MRRYAYLPPIIVICTILAITVIRNLSGKGQYYSDSALMMGTVVEIGVWGRGEVPARTAVDSAFAAIARIEHLFGDGMVDSRTDQDVIGSDEFQRLLRVSKAAHGATLGRFDPTIGSVSGLWHFEDGARPPDRDSIRNALGGVGFERYLADTSSCHFIFDLGGIAKGYAVDVATQLLRELGFRSALVNAGGDMKLIGSRIDGKPWRIAIRHPRRKGAFIGCLELVDVSVATSGDYEKFFLLDGKRYHHILDPETGMPGDASTSVTVIASDACLSDALATGLFLLGPEQGLPVVEMTDGVDAVFVYAEGESVKVSSGLVDRFERFELE